MVFNSDWLLSQIRDTANMIGKVFKLENIQIDLGMTEDEEGRLVNGNDYLNQLVIDEKFDLAIAFINHQIKRLSPYQYQYLVDVFTETLKALDPESKDRNDLDAEKIESIHDNLKQFKW